MQARYFWSGVFIGAILALTFCIGARAHPYPHAKPWKKMTLVQKKNFLVRAGKHYKYWSVHANTKKQRHWHKSWLGYNRRSLHTILQSFNHPSFNSSISSWLPTADCESGDFNPNPPYHPRWNINTGNGYYGGLQFDLQTWIAHGGLRYASYPHLASATQQVAIAERLTYDGWPNCPNP